MGILIFWPKAIGTEWRYPTLFVVMMSFVGLRMGRRLKKLPAEKAREEI